MRVRVTAPIHITENLHLDLLNGVKNRDDHHVIVAQRLLHRFKLCQNPTATATTKPPTQISLVMYDKIQNTCTTTLST